MVKETTFDPVVTGGVVAGFDGSPASRRAVAVAAEEAAMRGVPLHVVRGIASAAQGYEVRADEIVNGKLEARTFTAKFVVVAAGSLGSTELLLRSRAAGGLTNISQRLGEAWSSNGDFLTPAIHPFRDVQPGRGPTITAAIDLLDGEYMSKAIFVEDGGLPDLARNALDLLYQRQVNVLGLILNCIDAEMPDYYYYRYPKYYAAS